MFLRLGADLLFGLGVFLGAAFGLGAAAFLGAATAAAVAAFFLLERLCVINFTARNRYILRSTDCSGTKLHTIL